MEWQPIETAPRGEVDFLATDGKWYAVGDFCEFYGFRIVHYTTCQEYDWYPTHWMPLPEPPE